MTKFPIDRFKSRNRRSLATSGNCHPIGISTPGNDIILSVIEALRDSSATASPRPTPCANTTAMASHGTRRECRTSSSSRRPPPKCPRSSSCAPKAIPIVPFGMGSSLEGHVNAIKGGLSIDLTRMTRVLRLSSKNLTLRSRLG